VEKKSTDRLKRALLLGFVLLGVFLIGAIWVEGVMEPESATPDYYRDTFKIDESVYLTATADALKYNPVEVGTPSPDDTHEHGTGVGQGQGRDSGHDSQGGQEPDH
jgi:hypothetical protein